MTAIARIIVGVVVITACSGTPPAPPGPDLPYLVVPLSEITLRVEAGQYVGVIPFRYTNHTSDTLVMTGCSPPEIPVLEWWTGTAWRPAYEHTFLLCLSPPFVVPPGTVLDRTRQIHVFVDSIGPAGRLILPYWKASRTVGEYRLVWSVQDQGTPAQRKDWHGGASRPLAERVSNTFRLRIARR